MLKWCTSNTRKRESWGRSFAINAQKFPPVLLQLISHDSGY